MSDEDTGYESDDGVWETWSERSWHCGCRYDPWPGQIFSEDEEEKETPYENAKRKGAESRAHMKNEKCSQSKKKQRRPRRDKIELVRGAIDTHTAETIPTEMSITPGDFSFVKDASVREMFDDAYKAITTAEAWEFVERDPGSGGFMFSSDPYSAAISKAMKYDGHSGASYGWTMRVMQQIARGGWDRFVKEYKEDV
jgi:hypothetical protein